MYDTDLDTIPRAKDSKKQPVGRLATVEEITSVAKYCRVVWPSKVNKCGGDTVYLTWGCTLAILCHEVTHAGQNASNMKGNLDKEAGAMQIEVRTLMFEGWTDEQILGLSHNNSRTKLLAQIRAIPMTDPIKDAYYFGLNVNQLPQ